MANTLDMVGLVWRVLQLSPKPFGTVISSFIGPGSRTKITKSIELLRSLKSRNIAFFVELKSSWQVPQQPATGAYPQALELPPYLKKNLTSFHHQYHLISVSVYFRSCNNPRVFMFSNHNFICL